MMSAAQNNASPMDGAPVIDFDKFKPTRSFTAARKRKDLVMRVLIALAFIVALIPLALKGVKYREVPAAKMLTGNLLVYGLGGIIIPFIAIKVIDVMIVALGFAL